MRILIIALLWSALGANGAEYRRAEPGYAFAFPRDHFEHPGFRTEWWYYTGNVRDAGGRRFGFELVFFRQGVPHEGGSRSVWDSADLYLAHAALSDPAGRKFRYDERLNRPGPGIAGASLAKQKIWNGNWSAVWNGDSQILTAISGEFRFRLEVTPGKAPVIHGENGVSRKSSAKGQASHYVSFTRLKVKGRVETDSAHEVTGEAWMDHEWFTEQLGADQVGWDWFSAQLENQTELMLFQLRRKDGTVDPFSAGTFVDAAGKARALKSGEFSLEPVEREGKYPVVWRIRVPSLGIDVECRGVLRDQQLKGARGGPSYWEGAVDYQGSHRGVGYLEMTGYEAPIKLQ